MPIASRDSVLPRMKRLLSLLVVSAIAAALALMIMRAASPDSASASPQQPYAASGESLSDRVVEPQLSGRSVAAVAKNAADGSDGDADDSPPSDPPPESTETHPGYLFDLAALQRTIESGLVTVENQEGRVLSSLDIEEIMSDMKIGFDQAQSLHEAMRSLEPSGPDHDNARTHAGTWELIAAVLPESLELLQGSRIGAQLKLLNRPSPGVQIYSDVPAGDLTMSIKGVRWSLSITVPHNVGPRALWREFYEIRRRLGELPNRMSPSSIPGAGTLSVEQLLGEAK